MPYFLDDIIIDKDNAEFNFAAEFVLQTYRPVYLTGKAGTGKTTFLKYLRATCTKKMAVLAPTGVAAVNAGGQTIHSFFNIKPSVYVPGDKRLRFNVPEKDEDKTSILDHFRYQREKLDLIRNLELLVIDEVSMVRCDLLDVIDQLLRHIRKRHFIPFGGVQVILIGDTFQLPPIANADDWQLLSAFYESPYFFSSMVMKASKPVYIELKKIYRQKDQGFIDLLNRIRLNRLYPEDFKLINSRYLHGFDPEGAEDYIILASHNRMVIETNRKRLDEINEEAQLFEADITGIFPESSYPADVLLELKTGAQVMMLRNDRNKRYFNGKIGHIISLEEDEIKVRFPDETEVSVIKEQWDNIRYKWDQKNNKVIEESVGTFTQYPVKLAWAITVHKSQGLTFNKVIADVGESFAHGQVYVALSRCTSFGGLLLRSPLSSRSIKTDPVVVKFAENETPETVLLHELEKCKANYHLRIAVKSWLTGDTALAAESYLICFEEKDADINRLLSLGDFAISRVVREVAGMLNDSLSEFTNSDEQDRKLKKSIRNRQNALKKSLLKVQSLSLLLEDLSQYPFAEPLIGSHSHILDTLEESIKKTRRLFSSRKVEI
ncbi:MAG TPA: AAA family ATPase [Lentimicrobium sp.]|nr:AAA family ATPase [Lentimicrobium sp.]